MDFLKDLFGLNGTNIIEYTKSLIENSKNIRRKICVTDEYTTNVKILMNDTFLYNTFLSVIHTSKIMNDKNFKYWNSAEEILLEYNYEFNTDIKLFKRTLVMYKNLTDTGEKKFLAKLINSMSKFGLANGQHKKAFQLINKMEEVEDKIYECLSEQIIIDVNKSHIEKSESLLSSVCNEDNKIKIDRNSFYYLIKRIENPNTRQIIENEYLKKMNGCISLLPELIITRKKYATLLNKESYFELVTDKNSDDSEEIKKLLVDFNEKLDNGLKNELVKMKTPSKKLALHDIIYNVNKDINKIHFKPEDVLKVIMHFIEKYFSLSLSITNKSNNIYSTFDRIAISDKNTSKIKGYLNIDLIKRDGKKVRQPISIRINDYFINPESKKEYLSNIAIIASYKDMKIECMTYNDVVLLFKEFGNVINICNLNDDDVEFSNLNKNIMEYIAYDDATLIALCKNKDKNDIKNIVVSKRKDIIFTLKLKCLNAYIDHIFHYSDGIINTLESTNTDDREVMITKIYSNTYDSIFSKVNDILEKSKYINPSIMFNFVNDTNGAVYNEILSLIFAYSVYKLVIGGKGTQYIHDVLENTSRSFKKSIKIFVSQIKEDYYDFFIKNFIPGNNARTIQNDSEIKIKRKKTKNTTETDSNYFYDNTVKSDTDAILNIKK